MNEEQLMRWRNPTWIERNGELITAILGAGAFGFAAVCVVLGMVFR